MTNRLAKRLLDEGARTYAEMVVLRKEILSPTLPVFGIRRSELRVIRLEAV